jgi:hypothetical protein
VNDLGAKSEEGDGQVDNKESRKVRNERDQWVERTDKVNHCQSGNIGLNISEK